MEPKEVKTLEKALDELFLILEQARNTNGESNGATKEAN